MGREAHKEVVSGSLSVRTSALRLMMLKADFL
jgi:hypothetical protein